MLSQLERFAKWQADRGKLPVTRKTYRNVAVMLALVIAATFARVFSHNYWLVFPAGVFVGYYAGIGILTTVTRRLSYELGYWHGRDHPDRKL